MRVPLHLPDPARPVWMGAGDTPSVSDTSRTRSSATPRSSTSGRWAEPPYAHGRTQVSNAEVSRLIFNDYDFVQETNELNYRGRDKLAAITAQLPATFAPVIIERTPWAPGLDESRRLTILSQMAAGPFPIPAERVLIGPPIARGLLGQDAWITNGNRLGQIGIGGLSGSTAAGFDAGGLSEQPCPLELEQEPSGVGISPDAPGTGTLRRHVAGVNCDGTET